MQQFGATSTVFNSEIWLLERHLVSPFLSPERILTDDPLESFVMPLPASPLYSTLELAKHDASAGAPERDHAVVAPENARELDAPQVFPRSLLTIYGLTRISGSACTRAGGSLQQFSTRSSERH